MYSGKQNPDGYRVSGTYVEGFNRAPHACCDDEQPGTAVILVSNVKVSTHRT